MLTLSCGNILAYLNSSTGQTLARYEYDPFGRVVMKEEDPGVAGRLHHQFSTKYCDAETGLNYYGFRYYSPELGRWPSRDPIEEDGGINLYSFVENDPVNLFDPDGQAPMSGGFPAPYPSFIPADGFPTTTTPSTYHENDGRDFDDFPDEGMPCVGEPASIERISRSDTTGRFEINMQERVRSR